MIKSKKELRDCLSTDSKIYLRKGCKRQFGDMLFHRESFVIWNFIKLMRKCEFYTNTKDKSLIHQILYVLYLRRYNQKCLKLGLIIGAGAFERGLCIYHTGNIVVNGYAKIGKNCKLHGSNCIGNSHDKNDCPVIGDNVRLGVGAKVFGNIYIADNITIAAGAVVTKSCYEKGVTLAGVPAKIIKKSCLLK